MIARAAYWRGQRNIGRLSRRCLLIAICIVSSSGCDGTPGPAEADANQSVRRIIALAPHLTELVFTAGAGDRLVGVVEYSDYPPESRALPRVGDSFQLDYKRVASLAPDLVLVWRSGTPLRRSCG